jgi:hypothetical protein
MWIIDELSKPVTGDAAGTGRRRLCRLGAEGALQQADILPMPA